MVVGPLVLQDVHDPAAPLAVRAQQAPLQLLAEPLARQAVQEEVQGVVEVHQQEAHRLHQVLLPYLLHVGGRGRGQPIQGLGRGQQQPGEGHAQKHGGQAAVEVLRRLRRRAGRGGGGAGTALGLGQQPGLRAAARGPLMLVVMVVVAMAVVGVGVAVGGGAGGVAVLGGGDGLTMLEQLDQDQRV